jgi:hypothetical protein
MANLLKQVLAVVNEAVLARGEPFNWEGATLDNESFLDPKGCLPLLCSMACLVAHHIGAPVPQLVLTPDSDASFNHRLDDVLIASLSAGAFLMVLRDTVLNSDPELQMQQQSVLQYMSLLQFMTQPQPAAGRLQQEQRIE